MIICNCRHCQWRTSSDEVNSLSVIFQHRDRLPLHYILNYIDGRQFTHYTKKLCILAAKKEYPKNKCAAKLFRHYEKWVTETRRIAEKNALTAKINDVVDKMKGST